MMILEIAIARSLPTSTATLATPQSAAVIAARAIALYSITLLNKRQRVN
jgi:hypothetical protein